MPNFNDINLSELAKEIQNLRTAFKNAAIEARNFTSKISEQTSKSGYSAKDTDDPFEIALKALGIHVPTYEEMRSRKQNPASESEIELAISLGLTAATKKITNIVDNVMISSVQTGVSEIGSNSYAPANPNENPALRDETKTADPLYPNDKARMIRGMEAAELYNEVSTKVVPGIVGLLLAPAGQAIVAGMTYVGEQVKEKVGEEIYKSRKAPKDSKEYYERNEENFKREEEAKKSKDYKFYETAKAKQDNTRVNTEYKGIILNGSQGSRNSKEVLGNTSKSKVPDPVETMVGVFGEVQKVGGAMSTLMQTLNIGADTFVGGIINGFNSALSIIQTMITVMQAVNTIKIFLPFATGGSVPGIGDTDSVPAMLTPGEYVVKKSVVNKFGSGFFEWINGGGLTNSLAGHYNGGGMVAAGAKQMVAVSIPDVKIKGSDLYLSWRRENNTHGRRSI